MNKPLISFISIFIVGVVFGLALTQLLPKEETKDIRFDDRDTYTYINPLLECENVNFEETNALSDIQKEVTDLVDIYTDSGQISFASVYYRDLNNGPWFAINEDERFTPASLIKVPLMMAFYKEAEKDPSILSRKIEITQDVSYEDQNFPPERALIKGNSYTVEELIERSLIDSDNVAYDVLKRTIDDKKIYDAFNDLGIDIEQNIADAFNGDPNGDIISVKEYSTFFRVLYNASYLSSDMSEQALKIMSQSTYKDGIVAGVSADTKVSHKYGERYFSFSGVHQLHDCGIVYNSRSPYVLCIMTRGYDFDHLISFIQTTTKTIDEFHSRGTSSE